MPQSLDNLDDRALVELALENKQEAYTRLLVRHKDRVQAFINKLIVNSPEAEDLVLMSFDKAFRNLKHYNPKYAFSTWLYSIVQNLCIDHFRKNRQFFVSLEEAQETEDINPEDVLIAEQQRQTMENMISRLKPEYAEVIRLRYMQYYAYEEIAATLDIPLGTVKTRLHRAKVMLARIFEEENKE
ncbi:MAG: RNA polymerase sigma factor [Bacteroidales bacterium]|jgi:RNA polymerase sigma-70 factor (ECF subfamily)|nr:RNA polymerase sigma factor [Bacteroidales bacterium]MDD2263821.1 RNA polymerase sigma factor [Bacteroidales bacterium]MDD2830961.1 RNA polymerase sigma factor [Bacteroidales bacterium]MDD3208231.1 RNA polymerase sigma factor [Bacteroidales bacterium]MDD3696727.1 RNA polymerase sigma factor [Bacteroidales bacterium]